MINQLFNTLSQFEELLWGYLGVPMILTIGIFLTFKSNFFQVRKFPDIIRTFVSFLRMHDSKKGGVHPLKAFFASIGGCVGVGNVVSICTAIQIGGPGALFWIWLTAIVGSMVKYAEVYLGLRYRVSNGEGGYNGGPMYFIQQVFKGAWAPIAVALFLCLYGIEIYQFNVVTESISTNTGISEPLIAFVFLLLILFAVSGGITRVGAISAAIIPLFVLMYVGMGLWVVFHNLHAIPGVLKEVFEGAFTGHAAMGGFIGSTLMKTMSQGIKRGCYASDIGAGYASVIYSESSVKVIEKQAALVIFDVFIDTFLICTTSVILILVTGVWKEPIDASMLVQTALGNYFPYMNFFMPFFLFLLGYSTINAFFFVGLKSAEFIGAKIGKAVYYAVAVAMFFIFSMMGTIQAQIVMTIAGGILLVINCFTIFMLRDRISFKFDYEEESGSPSEINEPSERLERI